MIMRLVFLFFIGFVFLLPPEAGAQSPTPEETEKFGELLNSKAYQSQLFTNVARSASDARIDACERPPEGIKRFRTLPLEPIQYGPDSVVKGLWIEQLAVKQCGGEHRVNILVGYDATQEEALKMMPLLPGSTDADPRLQKDSLPVIFANLSTRQGLENCENIAVTDTKMARQLSAADVEELPGNGPFKFGWEEVWSFHACGKDYSQTVQFIQREGVPGTDIVPVNR